MLSRNMTNRAGNMVSNWFQTVTWTTRIKEPRRRRENHFNQFKSLLNAGRISSKIVVASSLHFYPGVGMINSFAVGMILMGDDGVGHQSVADSVTTTNCSSPLPPQHWILLAFWWMMIRPVFLWMGHNKSWWGDPRGHKCNPRPNWGGYLPGLDPSRNWLQDLPIEVSLPRLHETVFWT